MDRILSDEEKIRRAMEISQRRNYKNYTRETTRKVNIENKKDYRLFKRMILQIIICLLIYLIFYLISTTNYVFSEEVIRNTNNILNYDINLEKIYNDCQNFIFTTFRNNNEESINGILNNVSINNETNLGTNKTIENSTSSNIVMNNVAIEENKSAKENSKNE